MITILNAVELSSDYLQKKGVESPRINAELLLANVLKCKRMDLYLKFDQPLTDEELSSYRQSIKRRGLREPLQYIVGNEEFYGLNFIVNKNVLVPRPETELLVEEIINRNKNKGELNILDIGTGSGNISISLSKNLPDSVVTSIDISDEAIKVAHLNAKLNNIDGNLVLKNIDVNNFQLNGNNRFDLIVSNPPYIGINEYNKLDKELLEHEPKSALTDNSDGFTFYKKISSSAPNWLKKEGKLYFEVGMGQADEVVSLMQKNGFNKIEKIKDYSGIERIIIGELL